MTYSRDPQEQNASRMWVCGKALVCQKHGISCTLDKAIMRKPILTELLSPRLGKEKAYRIVRLCALLKVSIYQRNMSNEFDSPTFPLPLKVSMKSKRITGILTNQSSVSCVHDGVGKCSLYKAFCERASLFK